MNAFPHWSASGLPELLGSGALLALLLVATSRALNSLGAVVDDDAPGASVFDAGRDLERTFSCLGFLLGVSALPLALYAGWHIGRLAQEAELATLSLWSGVGLHMGSADQLLGLAPSIVTRVLGQALLPVISFFLILRPLSWLDRSSWQEYRDLVSADGPEGRRRNLLTLAVGAGGIALLLTICLMIYVSLAGQPAGAWTFVIGFQIAKRCYALWTKGQERAQSRGSKNEGESDDQA